MWGKKAAHSAQRREQRNTTVTAIIMPHTHTQEPAPPPSGVRAFLLLAFLCQGWERGEGIYIYTVKRERKGYFGERTLCCNSDMHTSPSRRRARSFRSLMQPPFSIAPCCWRGGGDDSCIMGMYGGKRRGHYRYNYVKHLRIILRIDLSFVLLAHFFFFICASCVLVFHTRSSLATRPDLAETRCHRVKRRVNLLVIFFTYFFS